MPAYIPPGVQRMLDRLRETPVAVFDAAMTQLMASPLYVALMGEHVGKERNALWRNFIGSPGRVRHTPESLRGLQAAQVAALRAAAQRYPGDRNVRRLIAELRARSDLFAELWDTSAVADHEFSSRIDHPQVGAITLDCDVLTVPGADLTIMVYTADPRSEDSDRLALLAVIGTQPLVG